MRLYVFLIKNAHTYVNLSATFSVATAYKHIYAFVCNRIYVFMCSYVITSSRVLPKFVKWHAGNNNK